MDSDEHKLTCGKCDNRVKPEDKAVTCFTCKQDFHIQCGQVSDKKYNILSDPIDGTGLVWFCRTCRRTTATMLRNVANLELRLKSIEEEREKERHEMTVLQNLVRALNKRLNTTEESIKESTQSNQGEIETIKEAVTTMLNEIPQAPSLEARFSSIEDSLNQISSLPSTDSRLTGVQSYDACPMYQSYSNESTIVPDISTLEVSNELSDRQRRSKNVVLHNVPDNDDPVNDAEIVATIFEKILGKAPEMQKDLLTNKARMYRLGRKVPGKNRTIKCHLTSQEECEQLLVQSRLLRDSKDHNNIVIQADLTPMQRSHIKQLVIEKKRLNDFARVNNEDADWIIRNGKLSRKRDLWN